MENTNDILTHDAFMLAFQNLELQVPVTIEHRVYFEPTTRECTYKTIYQDPGEYTIVTREEYDAIEFCPNYYVTKSGKIAKKYIDFNEHIKLQLDSSGFRTVKDNNIFLAKSDYTGPTEFWGLKRNKDRS